MSVARFAFQACSLNHSDISPSLKSYTWLAFEIARSPNCDTSPNVPESLTSTLSPRFRLTELSKEPGLCRLPIPHHGLRRDVYDIRRFLYAQAAEEPQFYDLAHS
jgi:hypothetical protein